NQMVELGHTGAILEVRRHRQVRPILENVVDEGAEIAFRTHLDEDPRAILIHPFDGPAEADRLDPVRDGNAPGLGDVGGERRGGRAGIGSGAWWRYEPALEQLRQGRRELREQRG